MFPNYRQRDWKLVGLDKLFFSLQKKGVLETFGTWLFPLLSADVGPVVGIEFFNGSETSWLGGSVSSLDYLITNWLPLLSLKGRQKFYFYISVLKVEPQSTWAAGLQIWIMMLFLYWKYIGDNKSPKWAAYC